MIFLGSTLGRSFGVLLVSYAVFNWITVSYYMRAEFLRLRSLPFVDAAKTLGFSHLRVIFSHVLPNALLSIITMFGMSVGGVLGGATIVETVFSYQGVGKMAADAVTSRDYNLIQAYVVWMALIFVAVNLGVDILYRVLDPRLRLGGE